MCICHLQAFPKDADLDPAKSSAFTFKNDNAPSSTCPADAGPSCVTTWTRNDFDNSEAYDATFKQVLARGLIVMASFNHDAQYTYIDFLHDQLIERAAAECPW